MVFGNIGHMARCTAPVYGHRTASGAAACPACGGRYGRYSGYGSYSSPSYYSPSVSSGGGRSSGGGSGRSARPRWSRAGSSVVYTPAEVRALTPVRNSVENLAKLPDLRDVFLCHAWDDRQGAAKELHDLLESLGVSVWFSEKDVGLGVPLLRAIDKGLANSRIGIVLVTPALLRRLPAEGIADKELSALLARDRLVPIVHETTYEALREVSPLLGSRSGLSTAEGPMADVARPSSPSWSPSSSITGVVGPMSHKRSGRAVRHSPTPAGGRSRYPPPRARHTDFRETGSRKIRTGRSRPRRANVLPAP
jgi:hypothetical protein